MLDTRYAHLHRQNAWQERSVIVLGSMEATLTPLMEQVEMQFPGVKVFSLPSMGHPVHGRHIELGVKGSPEQLERAYPAFARWTSVLCSQARPRIGAMSAKRVHREGATICTWLVQIRALR